MHLIPLFLINQSIYKNINLYIDLFIKSFKMYCSHISNHVSDRNIYLLNGTICYLIFLKFI
jgi:hypothetical protein